MFAHSPIVRDIIYGAVRRGADFTELCKRAGVQQADLNDSARMIDFERSYKTWEHAVTLTGDPLLGLHLGESTTPAILGLIGHLMQSSPDLFVAFKNVCKYSLTATDMFHYTVAESKSEVVLGFEPAALWSKVSPSSAHQAVDQATAGVLNVFELLSGMKIFPLRARFTMRRPKAVKEYERVFRCELTFHAKGNELIFDKRALKTPVLTYDRSLFQSFDRMLADRKNLNDESISRQVKQLMAGEFRGQIPPLDVTASRLSLTVRSLQRRLMDESTTYRELAAAVQKEAAVKMLSSRTVKVKDVSRVLGYSEASAFRRAYKKWTGHAPKEKRK